MSTYGAKLFSTPKPYMRKSESIICFGRRSSYPNPRLMLSRHFSSWKALPGDWDTFLDIHRIPMTDYFSHFYRIRTNSTVFENYFLREIGFINFNPKTSCYTRNYSIAFFIYNSYNCFACK